MVRNDGRKRKLIQIAYRRSKSSFLGNVPEGATGPIHRNQYYALAEDLCHNYYASTIDARGRSVVKAGVQVS
jgi:hypothetical protein